MVHYTINSIMMDSAINYVICVIIALLLVTHATDGTPLKYESNEKASTTCGYKLCPATNSSKLNVHIVPHSHDDVGWLKTVDQYYYGSQHSYQTAGVQYIIDSVVDALLKSPKRRFVLVESAFFHKWWTYQNDATKEKVKTLIDNGRLEIIGGAWSMNDEAAVHYQSVIDQFTLGLKFLNDSFGECGRPKVGWQIDPFGHSREMASIFAQLGYDGLFFSRLDWRDKTQRLNSKTAELVWRGSANLGNETNLFTSVLYNHYSAPSGFCFDVKCSDDPIIDDEESPDFNYKEKVEGFADFIRTQADNYATNNIIITMGDDFHYQDALSYFLNLDALIRGFSIYEQKYNDKPINVFYSTPSCYLKSVYDEAQEKNLTFTLKTDDFFPYANDPHAYWTGYFTSRPTSKRLERQGNNMLQVVKQLSTFDQSKNSENYTLLQQAMGVMQHHDAITGTEKQHVANDYHRLMSKAVGTSINASSEYISNILSLNSTSAPMLNLTSCPLANMSYCPESNSINFTVVVYNPLSRTVSHYVRLPVNSSRFSILGPDDASVEYQVTKQPADFSYTGKNVSNYELVFLARELPPLGLKMYYITNLDPEDKNNSIVADTSNPTYLGNETFGIFVTKETGKLNTITIHNTSHIVSQELMYYESSAGNNSNFEFRASGAYIFRPSADNPNATSFTEVVNTTTYKGELFDEIHQVFSSWAKQVIRVYKEENHLEFDWIIGPIDISDDKGKEVISRFVTTFETDDTFYTDSNGREILKRTRDYRSSYNYTDEEPIAGNYYPVTSKIMLSGASNISEQHQFAVLNDRAQGGTSLASGQVELMVHRRCLYDDAFGVGERLNETEYGQGLVARGQHYVTINPTANANGKTAAVVERDIAQRKLLAPWVFISKDWSSLEGLKKSFSFTFSGLTKSLPDKVQILTLEPWEDNTVLLRLEHVLETNEDPYLSTVTVDLEGLFATFNVTSLHETTLGANQWLEDKERFTWTVAFIDPKVTNPKNFGTTQSNDLSITLDPMQIRTFIATVSYN